MSSSRLGLLGAVVGLGAAVAVVVASNKDIRDEASDQMRTVLKNTRKVVRHYTRATNALTARDRAGAYSAHEAQPRTF